MLAANTGKGIFFSLLIAFERCLLFLCSWWSEHARFQIVPWVRANQEDKVNSPKKPRTGSEIETWKIYFIYLFFDFQPHFGNGIGFGTKLAHCYYCHHHLLAFWINLLFIFKEIVPFKNLIDSILLYITLSSSKKSLYPLINLHKLFIKAQIYPLYIWLVRKLNS